jgi:hypothetical protein
MNDLSTTIEYARGETMTENITETEVSNTTSSRGAQWAGAGSLIALAAQSLLGNGNGGGILSNVLGGNNNANAAITSLMMENSILKANADTDKKLVEVYTALRTQDKEQDVLSYSLDKRVTALETAAPLREQIMSQKIDNVALIAQNGIASNSLAIQNLQTTVNSIVTPVIKNSTVCPGWGNVTITPSSLSAS